MTTFEATTDRRASHKAPRYFAWSAYAVPLLILSGFGLVTTLTIALLSYGAIRDTRARALRWWVALTSGLFAIPFTFWLFRSDPGASLSSMLHPVMAGAIVLSSLVIIAKVVKGQQGKF
jgi:hypothetical protein